MYIRTEIEGVHASACPSSLASKFLSSIGASGVSLSTTNWYLEISPMRPRQIFLHVMQVWGTKTGDELVEDELAPTSSTRGGKTDLA